MKKVHMLRTPTRVSDLRLEEYDEDEFYDMQLKAERLARSQRRLRLNEI